MVSCDSFSFITKPDSFQFSVFAIVVWKCKNGISHDSEYVRGIFMSDHKEHSNAELAEVKKKLKAGKLDAKDLAVLESLVERTEQAAKQLRAAIVE
jgi:hypothetical protein